MKFLFLIFTIFIFFITFGTSTSLYLKEDLMEIIPKLQIDTDIPEIFFSCGGEDDDKKFISEKLICNGKKDCKNGFDEENCEKMIHDDE